MRLTPTVAAPADAEEWLQNAEGVIAKELSAPYRPGERKGMVKVKRVRTIDCVVVGWRPGKEDGTVGSLILGLYDDAGELHVVGHASGFGEGEARARRDPRALRDGRARLGRRQPLDGGRELEWVALRPELVVEITFDHTSGGRIRHGTKIVRWREDKAPRDCKLEQLQS